MSTFWLPYEYEEELKVLQELRELDFLDYDQKDKVAKMISDLKYYGFLEDSQRRDVDVLLNDYGVYV